MKKICFTLFAFLLIAYYVQAQNIEQKITGTWTDKKEGSTWIFNANGTMTLTPKNGNTDNGRYGIACTKLSDVL